MYEYAATRLAEKEIPGSIWGRFIPYWVIHRDQPEDVNTGESGFEWGVLYTQVRAAPQTLCTCSKTAYVKGALYWIHSQNPALVSWPIRHVTYRNRSPVLAAYTATQNIVPQVEHEIKVSIKICVVRTLGYMTLGQAPPSLTLILAAREIQYTTPDNMTSH